MLDIDGTLKPPGSMNSELFQTYRMQYINNPDWSHENIHNDEYESAAWLTLNYLMQAFISANLNDLDRHKKMFVSDVKILLMILHACVKM